MAKGDWVVQGTATLAASAAGVIASVTVTATGAGANDIVMITPIETATDGNGAFQYKVTGITTNTFVITADREQLPTDVDFMYVVFDSA